MPAGPLSNATLHSLMAKQKVPGLRTVAIGDEGECPPASARTGLASLPEWLHRIDRAR